MHSSFIKQKHIKHIRDQKKMLLALQRKPTQPTSMLII